MKTGRYLLSLAILPLLLSTVAFNTGLAHALPSPTSKTACTLTTVATKDTVGTPTKRQPDSHFIISGSTVSAAVVVTGPSTCQVGATLTTWDAPNPGKGQPYDQQHLFAQISKVFTPGNYTMSVALPDCFFQVDLTQGAAANPNVGNSFPNGTYYGSLHGGTQACTTPTPPNTPTPPTTPTTPVTPVPPAVLPNTGPGSDILGVAGITAIAGTAFSYVRRARRFAL
jgi:hypothetical protein